MPSGEPFGVPAFAGMTNRDEGLRFAIVERPWGSRLAETEDLLCTDAGRKSAHIIFLRLSLQLKYVRSHLVAIFILTKEISIYIITADVSTYPVITYIQNTDGGLK